MSGGRFLVSLREVLTSKRILAVNSLLKGKVNFWEEDLSLYKDPVFDEFALELQSISAEIQEASLCAESGINYCRLCCKKIGKYIKLQKMQRFVVIRRQKNMVINT